MERKAIPDIVTLGALVKRDEAVFGRAPWITEHLVAPHVAIHLTACFLRLGWSGDRVTLLMLAGAIAGPILFALGGMFGWAGGAAFMLISFVLDHSDGQVRRFRGEDSNLGVYLDRFTHRVSYPLQHIAMGVSLFHLTGRASYLLFGGVVAYVYQLVVAQRLDKEIIDLERGGVDRDPLKTVRLALTARMPALKWPLIILVVCYSHLVQNVAFVTLLIVAALVGSVPEYYVLYGALVIFDGALRTLLNFTIVFPPQFSSPKR